MRSPAVLYLWRPMLSSARRLWGIRVEKIKPFWRIVIGLCLLSLCVYNTNMLTFGGNFFAFAFWWAVLAAYIFLAVKIKYDDPLRSMRDLIAAQTAEQAASQSPAEEARAKREAEREAEAARRAAWEEAHGRIKTAIAGVTFKNEDGASRQALLKDLKASGGFDAELHLEEYEYKGAPAIRVTVDGEQIGNIPKSRVAEVSAVLDRLESASLEVETFRPEEEEDEDGNVRQRGELIYRADLYLVYTK